MADGREWRDSSISAVLRNQSFGIGAKQRADQFGRPSTPIFRICLIYFLAWFAFYGIYFLHFQIWYLLRMIFVDTLAGTGLWARLVE